MSSITDKLKAARDKAERDRIAADEAEKRKVDEKKKLETEKVECDFCHKKYKDIDVHKKKCESNPENSKKDVSSKVMTPFAMDTDSAFFHIDENSPVFKKLVEKLSGRKNRSASAIFTDLIEHCKKSKNPVFEMIVKNTTDARRHWRSIVISTIDALIDMGVI